MKKYYKWLFVIIWMVLIFLFSNESGITSTNTSNLIVKKVIFLEDCFGISFETLTFFIRKSAHFILYFILGIFILNATKGIKNDWLTALLLCLLYACTDEVHQLFVMGRSGELKDVLIDFIGSSLGVYCCYYYFHRFRRIA